MSKEMRKDIDKFKNFLLREQDENSNFEDFEGVNEYIFILYFDVSAGNIPQSEYDDVTIEDVEKTIKNKLGSFYHYWNISYDEREKVHIWLKKLERVG